MLRLSACVALRLTMAVSTVQRDLMSKQVLQAGVS